MPPVNPRATTPRAQKPRLISSVAMLVVAAVGVSYYSVRKTNELFDIGVKAHVQCAVARYESQSAQASALADALKAALAAGGMRIVALQTCSAAGREYTHIVLRQGSDAVSVALTRRGEQEIFPRAFAGHVVNTAGIPIHEATRGAYRVAAFDAGPYLAYVVSALPDAESDALAARLAPLISQYAAP